MRIVDRKEFLTLPSGTIFAKFSAQPKDRSHHDLSYGEVSVKCDSRHDDFVVQYLFPSFEGCTDSVMWSDALIAMLNGDASPQLDYDCACRDGLFDRDQLFAVWDKDDARRLIDRLELAFTEAYTEKADH